MSPILENTLWISALNESKQMVRVGGKEIQVQPLKTTLEILFPYLKRHLGYIRNRIHRILVTDDGSTDDTAQDAEDFRKSHKLSAEQLIIQSFPVSLGKVARFCDAVRFVLDIGNGNREFVLIMTDADMVSFQSGGKILSRLAFQDRKFGPPQPSEIMRISSSFEAQTEIHSAIPALQLSGTRSLLIRRFLGLLQSQNLSLDNLPATGYGLEVFLHEVCPRFTWINGTVSQKAAPTFLPAYRKGFEGQSGDIDISRASLRAAGFGIL